MSVPKPHGAPTPPRPRAGLAKPHGLCFLSASSTGRRSLPRRSELLEGWSVSFSKPDTAQGPTGPCLLFSCCPPLPAGASPLLGREAAVVPEASTQRPLGMSP